ncbi:MAG: hypothetical protein MSH48_00920 [Mollicutes bacterium]|nr:hypothetical protein [Mollicutes bacterium]
MYKKIIIVLCLFLFTGCTRTYYMNSLSYEEILNNATIEENNLHNTNNKGFKYYLPTGFSVTKDNEFNQTLTSHNNIYYLNIDIVSYYYKKGSEETKEIDDYYFYKFNKNNKDGYLRIRKNNDKFFVELCYNYAIIEVEVEENEIKYAVSRGITILNSIKYNDTVIEKKLNDKDLESKETAYKIPEPKEKNEIKNVLEYINENEE